MRSLEGVDALLELDVVGRELRLFHSLISAP